MGGRMSVYGSRLLGKVDVVPGMFFVATKCGHINFVPLIPMQSYLVLNQSGNKFNGIKIPLSWKSWGMAWLRCVGWLGGLIGAIFVLVGFTAHYEARPEEWVPGAVAIGVAIVVLVVAYKFKPLTHASYERAQKLGEIAKLNEEGMAQLRAIYGMGPTAAGSAAGKPKVPPRVSPQQL
jgi:hypothetical protein